MIVHFGMPKTGTSSIQDFLYWRLSDPRFHYVDLGRSNASIPIATAFKSAAAEFQFHVKSGTSADELLASRTRIRERLEAQLRTAGDRTAILSGEAISGLKESEFRDLCGVLTRERPAAVTAVGYVRRPKEFMESSLQQRVKSGHAEFDMARISPRYRTRIEKFDTVLGRDNVRVWPFEPGSFRGQCVVQDLCARLGIRVQPKEIIRRNDGLSRPAVSLLFAYWRFGPGFGTGPGVVDYNRRLTRHMRQLDGPKLRLHSSLVRPVIADCRKEIEWMEARLGSSLTEELAAHDHEAVREEQDLLRFTPQALQWLANQLGADYEHRWHPEMDARQVAEWMHTLHTRLPARAAPKPKTEGRPAASPASISGPEVSNS